MADQLTSCCFYSRNLTVTQVYAAPLPFFVNCLISIVILHAEIVNELDNINIGTEMYLYDNDENRTCYTYEVSEKLIVDPEETWILNDFDDDRITVVTCTDDGMQRQVVIGMKK